MYDISNTNLLHTKFNDTKGFYQLQFFYIYLSMFIFIIFVRLKHS